MDTNKKDILESLEYHKGIVTTACKSIGLARSTYYSWIENDPEFKTAVEEIQETAIDFVESKLMEKISGVEVLDKMKDGEAITYTLPPSDTAIIFFLKTKGRKRGYNERVLHGEDPEHPLPSNMPPTVNIYNSGPPLASAETEISDRA